MARTEGFTPPAGIAWDPDPSADDYLVYRDTADDENFAELADSGQWPVHATIPQSAAPEYLFTDEDPDDADWLVISHAVIDGVEYWSDPHSPEVWQDIDLDGANPLVGASNGRLFA